ncbi:MAG: hypothetical protein JXQ75_24110 [Phycisphaerae bacterium]|nr:hypothetical protein [Phycisphaerae bacterium]
MPDERYILAAGGDVGGSRALLPGLLATAHVGRAVRIVDSGVLAREAPAEWVRFRPDEAAAVLKTQAGAAALYTFSTSLRDHTPLGLARVARSEGVPTVAVLDNWMNYRARLEIDGAGFFLPDVYAVMDDYARDRAVAEGIPAEILKVTGHPALAGLRASFESFDRRAARRRFCGQRDVRSDGRRLVVFISEPAAHDQGEDASSPAFRGYTERTVLKHVADALQPFADRLLVGLVPHPREDAESLRAHWENCRGRLDGGCLRLDTGREAVFAADGVCGMASLLLYEALLLGKPVISVQPDLRVPALRFLEHKGVDEFVTDRREIAPSVNRWMARVMAGVTRGYHDELSLHAKAPQALASVMVDLIEIRGGR